MSIPVFHDDQHGTAIIVGAAVMNALRLVGKKTEEVKVVSSGAGAAALACLRQLVSMGVRKENIVVTDIHGVVYKGRKEEMDQWKSQFAVETEARTLGDVIEGADIFLGLSAPGVLTKEHAKRMAPEPLIMALANPDPEITPEDAKEARPDAIIATGRSDYPNQVNNVLCFPFIFRGALDVGATEINEAMELACVKALADLAMAETSELVSKAYGGQPAPFGPENLIPKPFDPRLIIKIAPAVARAAMDSGVATRPIEDFDAYQQKLTAFVYQSGLVMKPIFDAARRAPVRLVYAEGEERRVLQAAQQIIDEKLADPVLVGRRNVIEMRIKQLGLRMRPDEDFELVNIHKDKRFREYWSEYHALAGRRGTSPEEAKSVVRTQQTAVAALMVHRGEADAMLCGTVGRFHDHLQRVDEIIGKAPGIRAFSTLIGLILPSGTFFICDTHVTPEPSAEEIAELTVLAADEVRCFGIPPKVALLSRSNFGTRNTPSATKMRDALELLRTNAPDLEVDGEMHADAALSESIREAILPNARLSGKANLLVMPNVDAANIAYNLLKMLGGGVTVGPILVGAARSVHVLTQSATVRGVVNMSALAVARASVTSKD
jgi:malate dehydrogenase (oxaloacetate-decarboxylating)(NADP+)